MAERKSEWAEWLKALVIVFVLTFVIRTYIVSPIVVDGPSMLPTLHDRDQMIVNKLVYHIKEPERFDIVIFHASSESDFIKRVIGLPGEHIAMRNNNLYVDDEYVEENFLFDGNKRITGLTTNNFELEELTGHHEVIPEGYVLVLGDNRNNSTDSRSIGLISIDDIVGRAKIIYWPLTRLEVVN